MPDETTTVVETTPTEKPALTSDQQKIATALEKTAIAAPNGDGKPNTTTPRRLRPLLKDPPKELLEKGSFDLSDESPEDLTHDESGNRLLAVKPKEETKKTDDKTTQKVEDTKTGNKSTEKATEPTEKPTAQPKTTDVVVKPDDKKPFDYAEFQPEEVAALKQMSNTARDFAAKNIRELKRLQTEAPNALFANPQAFTLLPEYNKLAEDIGYAAREREFWKQQLIRVKAGKEWQVLKGWDKNGNPIIGETLKATEDAEVDLTNVLQTVTSQVSQMQGQMTSLQQGFQKRFQDGMTVLQAERAKRFAWVGDNKLLDEKIEIPGMGEVPIKKIREDFQNLFDSVHHSNPLMELAKDMFAALQIYGSKIRALEAVTKNEKQLREDVTRMEPSPETATAIKSGNGDGEFNMEGLPE